MENRKNYKQQRQKLLRLRNNCNQAVFFGIPAQGMEIFSLTKHIFWMDLGNCNFGSTSYFIEVWFGIFACMTLTVDGEFAYISSQVLLWR